MNQSVGKEEDLNRNWIFIPLTYEDALNVYYWIKRLARTEEEDKLLAEKCELAIISAFNELNLNYNVDEFGVVKLDSLRFHSGNDGIAIPERFFVNPDANTNIQRIKSPLRTLME